MKKNVMVDLETLDTAPTAVILSVGAVKFDKDGVYETFYKVVNTESCVDFDRSLSVSTLSWWLDKDPAAQAALKEALNGEGEDLEDVLREFAEFVENSDLWGNGSDFDNVILADSMRACGLNFHSSYTNNRCYRTLRNLFPNIPRERHGVHHNALDDAITQARHASAILKHIASFPPEKGSGNDGDDEQMLLAVKD